MYSTGRKRKYTKKSNDRNKMKAAEKCEKCIDFYGIMA
jgi:hypothetical protein